MAIKIPGTDIELPPWAIYVGVGGLAAALLMRNQKPVSDAEDETDQTANPNYGALLLADAQQSYDSLFYEIQNLLGQQSDFTAPPGATDTEGTGTEPGSAPPVPGGESQPGSDDNIRTGPSLIGPPVPVIPSVPGTPGTDGDGSTEPPAPAGPVSGTEPFAAGDLATSTYNGRPPWKGTGLTGPEWEKASPQDRKAAIAAKKARKRAREAGNSGTTSTPRVKFVSVPPGFTVPAGPNPR